MNLPKQKIPLQTIRYRDFEITVKREDLIDPRISGNKYWKLFYNINDYLATQPEHPMLITFGGAFSNHIAATAACAEQAGIRALGIIRGEELQDRNAENPTLQTVADWGMRFRFIDRATYRDKEKLTVELQREFPSALILPEGGTNEKAVRGIAHMLTPETAEFNYLCTAVGTGGTVAGLACAAKEGQEVLGFPVVKDLELTRKIESLCPHKSVRLIWSDFGGYGKINADLVRFINWFWHTYQIPLDPIYTGKMMRRLLQMVEEGFFKPEDRILAFHTGGLQGIAGANRFLKKKGRETLDFNL